jgi:phage terminase small subunit
LWYNSNMSNPQQSLTHDTLSDRELRFVTAYLTTANMVGYRAAEEAGIAGTYMSRRAEASRILAKPSIKQAIRDALREDGMTVDECIKRLSDMARGTLDDFVDVAEDGSMTINMVKAKTRGLMHTFKTIQKTKEGWKIERHSALEALDRLARIHKLYGDDQEKVDMNLVNAILSVLPDELRQHVHNSLQQMYGVQAMLPPGPTTELPSENVNDEDANDTDTDEYPGD